MSRSAGYMVAITDGGYPTCGAVSLFGFLEILLGPVRPGLVVPLTVRLTLTCLLGMVIAW